MVEGPTALLSCGTILWLILHIFACFSEGSSFPHLMLSNSQLLFPSCLYSFQTPPGEGRSRGESYVTSLGVGFILSMGVAQGTCYKVTLLLQGLNWHEGQGQ